MPQPVATTISAYAKLHAFIKDGYLPQCRGTSGIGALSGGSEAYAYVIRLQTTTDMTAEEIHALGLRQAAVPRFFAHVPQTKFEIRATEKIPRGNGCARLKHWHGGRFTAGYFLCPGGHSRKLSQSSDGRPFLPRGDSWPSLPDFTDLEKNSALPKFRRYDASNAYVEGWALYCESMGKELGMFSDPYQYFGRLYYDMHRAVRLVVDTGIHAKGWSREQALQYAEEQEGCSPTRQCEVAEIERYMAWSGQTLGYKIGQLKIRELRNLAEQQLGEKFEIKAFRDEVLMEGALLLAVLETRIKDWIARTAAK